MDARVKPAHDDIGLGEKIYYRPIASAIRPSVPTMTRHHANSVKPRRLT
jgi:hypothetical protein